MRIKWQDYVRIRSISFCIDGSKIFAAPDRDLENVKGVVVVEAKQDFTSHWILPIVFLTSVTVTTGYAFLATLFMINKKQLISILETNENVNNLNRTTNGLTV